MGQSVKKARSVLAERACLCGGYGGVIGRLGGAVAVLSWMAAGGVGALLVEGHQLIVDRIDGAVGAEGAVGELAEAHADEIGLARFAFGKGDVAVVLLGYPFPEQVHYEYLNGDIHHALELHILVSSTHKSILALLGRHVRKHVYSGILLWHPFVIIH